MSVVQENIHLDQVEICGRMAQVQDFISSELSKG